jgi:hypothetical protein
MAGTSDKDVRSTIPDLDNLCNEKLLRYARVSNDMICRTLLTSHKHGAKCEPASIHLYLMIGVI